MKFKRIVLASHSPRRKELLAGLGLDFCVNVKPDIDESYPAGLESREVPLHIAKKKADAYHDDLDEDELLITADTVVIVDDCILGKPHDAAEAFGMLRRLSGRTHLVTTGVCLMTKKARRSFGVTTRVTFKELSDEEIDRYIRDCQPFDKAGAYGIQEWIGYIGVTNLEGSFYNVMGLPVQRIYEEMKLL
ncbi:Maf-like protein [Segatella baroniae]|uniref:dTTP/UTP pyrophosphatase n=1 Tax=Segatella baroniae F0067 TaxID=1115809 RepID=U2NN63_9BACT|nr:Maf-like protein [Segatella baroniae]ERK39485.1 septum formation protein Maf [Segatella baroniae F0067]